MTTEYILTHTPREIANEHTLEEIQHEIRYSVVEEFEDGDALIGGFSWEEFADEPFTVAACQQSVNEWFSDRDPEDRPTAESLAIAYQLHCAASLALNRDEDPDDAPEAENPVWYAVMRDRDDNDWGTGSRDYDEAVRMAQALRDDGYSDAYIAVIDDGDDPVCTEEITDF